jgi:PAB-dependent poly(A)-specific ribonuclease subunit 2
VCFSSGEKNTLKPAYMAVARISVVGGSGRLEGATLIDDYIHNHEVVADYVTQYSGIRPGDLDPTTSTKHLTTLKVGDLHIVARWSDTVCFHFVFAFPYFNIFFFPPQAAYSKLRYLETLGVIFVGHGLSKDFRVINLTINPSQIIDTVDIYHLP